MHIKKTCLNKCERSLIINNIKAYITDRSRPSNMINVERVAHKDKPNLDDTRISPIQLVRRTSSLLKPIQHKPKQANPPHDTTYLKSTPLLTTRLIHRMIRPSCEKLKACIIQIDI